MSRYFEEEFRQSMDALRFQPADKDRLHSKLVLSQNKTNEREANHMKKWTFKRAAAVAAACLMITGVTAFAAGKISSYNASSKAGYDYKTTAQLNDANDSMNPAFPESLGNSFSFAGGNNVHVNGVDESGNTVGEWNDLQAEYKDKAGKKVAVSATTHPADENDRTATESRTIAGIDVKYNCDEYLFLPDENSELDAAVKNRMENDDHFFVSYGSDKEETIIYKGVSFEQDGVFYHLYTSDSIDSEELFQMAAELID